MPGGRPSGYDPRVAELICDAVADGMALHVFCQMEGAPSRSMVYRWLDEEPEFRDKYARAREMQQDFAADEIVRIAEVDRDPQRARNRIDALKWRAAKLAPRKYGDKLDMNINATVRTIPNEELNARLAELLRKAGGVDALGGAGAPQIEGQTLDLPAIREAT